MAKRKSLLKEYVDAHGSDGLNKSYVSTALHNGGGFGRTGVSKNTGQTEDKPKVSRTDKAGVSEAGNTQAGGTAPGGTPQQPEKKNAVLHLWDTIGLGGVNEPSAAEEAQRQNP